MALSKEYRRKRIKMRVRKNIDGTATTPRLSVFRSNKSIYAQLIDDLAGTTLLAAASTDKAVKAEGTKIEQANIVGKALAEKLLLQESRNVFSTETVIYTTEELNLWPMELEKADLNSKKLWQVNITT